MNRHDREDHELPLGTFYGRTVYGNGIFNRSLEPVEYIKACANDWKTFLKGDCAECRVHSRIALHEWQMALLLKRLMNLDKLRYPNYYKWNKWEKGEDIRD